VRKIYQQTKKNPHTALGWDENRIMSEKTYGDSPRSLLIVAFSISLTMKFDASAVVDIVLPAGK